MSLTPHFSSLTQPLSLVALGDLLSLAMDADVKNAIANKTSRSFFICDLSPWRIIRGKLRSRSLPPDCTYGVRADEKVTGILGKWNRFGTAWIRHRTAVHYFFCCEVCCEGAIGAAGRV